MNLRKMFAAGAIIAGGLLTAAALKAARVIYSQNLVNETALAYDTTYAVDMGHSVLPGSNIDALSMQAAYSTATLSAVTFNDGTPSTAAITISSAYASLHGTRGTATLYVATNSLTAISGDYFDLNGIRFLNGDLWTPAALSSNTAVNIAASVNAYSPSNATFLASATGSTVTFTCVSSGAFCNSLTLVAGPNTYVVGPSTPLVFQVNGSTVTRSGTFSGGVNNAFVILAGTSLTEGVDWTASGSAAITAKSIADGINGNASLSTIIKSSWTAGGVVTATSTAVGANRNYGISVSSVAIMTVTNKGMYGGTDSAVTTASNSLALTAHHLTTALPVLFTKSAGTPPGLLSANVTYYAIRTDANNIKLASSKTNAIAGTAVGISSQTALGGGSFTLTPLAFTGFAAFKWQVSNDNSNWSDVNVSSVTIFNTTAAGSTIWDFGTVNHRYIRLNETGPTTGGIVLTVVGNGKNNN